MTPDAGLIVLALVFGGLFLPMVVAAWIWEDVLPWLRGGR